MQPEPQDPRPASRRETVSIKNVRKFFGPTRALDGVSFSAAEGEIHAIVGGNGCGKSTLAKVISGILPVDAGAVTVLGETPNTPAESRVIGISTVYQEVLVADESTVVDNVFMGADTLFSKTVAYDDKVDQTARLMRDLSGEDVDPHGLVGNLPLGLKQWITIARGMLSEPRVLILDESSAALDFDSTERLFQKMRDLRDAGTTILIVTHRIAELVRIADRATVLRDGQDVAVLEKKDITERNLLTAMTGEDIAGSGDALEAPVPQGDDILMRADGLMLWPAGKTFDFELRKDEIVGVSGLDGQGQDTFVRVMAGVQPAEASVPFVASDGQEFVPIRDLSDAVAGRVVYVSGDRKREGIFANLSIFENMVMPLYAQKKTGGVLGLIDWETLGTVFERETKNLMIKFGLQTDKITSLSGGNQQKVLIGRGFAQRPGIIVLNDPARGIDVGAKTELYKHLRAFAASGRSVIYMSSEIEEFTGFATRILVFRDGAPFDAFDGRRFETKQVLEAMFGQTDGTGLTKSFGLTPTRADPSEDAAGLAARGIGLVHYPSADEASPPIRVVHTQPDPAKTFNRSKVKIVEFGRAGAASQRHQS